MTFTKQQRQEDMEQEKLEDLKREKIIEASNEYDDGAMDVWIGEHIDELMAEFIYDYNIEWDSYCRGKWNEENE